MAEIQHLDKAPILEGLIDLRVELPENFDVRSLSAIYEEIKDMYPVSGEQRLFKGEIQINSDEEHVHQVTSGELNGFIYRTADETQIVQFRLDGFTFSRLEPYTSWEEAYPEAMRLWHLYRETTAPRFITRLAVRFINHLTIPTPFKSFSDYLIAAPRGPENVSLSVSSFLTRLTINEANGEVFTDITQALASESDETKAVIYLDIDVHRDVDNLDPNRTDEIDETLLRLREIKNKTFFGSITERMVDLLK